MKTHRPSAAAFLAAAVLISACGENGPLENTPASERFNSVITATAGTGLSGLYGNFVAGVPRIRLADRQGNALVGVAITFEAIGGGRVTGAAAITDSAGTAAPTSWRFGMSGDQAVRASAPDAAPLVISASAAAPPPGTFRIQVRYVAGTDPTPAQRAAFDSAVQKWTALIRKGGAPYQIYEVGAGCGDLQGETVDGLVIMADLKALDGPGQILGSAAPCILRDEDYLPALGLMQFDTADLATLEGRGQLEQVILHEMAHVLGFGTIWDINAGRAPAYLLRVPEDNPTFQGPAARAAFFGLASIGGFSGAVVPVENTGAVGTRFSHWREAVFGQELMTGWLNAGINPLSALTIAQFRDLGYVVNDAMGETYSFAAAIQAQIVQGPLALVERQPTTPMVVVNRTGRIVRTVDRRFK